MVTASYVQVAGWKCWSPSEIFSLCLSAGVLRSCLLAYFPAWLSASLSVCLSVCLPTFFALHLLHRQCVDPEILRAAGCPQFRRVRGPDSARALETAARRAARCRTTTVDYAGHRDQQPRQRPKSAGHGGGYQSHRGREYPRSAHRRSIDNLCWCKK